MIMRIDFYHLKTKMMEQVLPVLAEKSLAEGKVLMRVSDSDAADYFDKFLWSCSDEGWLPHGLDGGLDAELQPFLITASEENLNGADILFVLSGVPLDLEQIIRKGDFKRVLIIFSDNDIVAKNAARALWTTAANGNCEHYYWKI